MKPGGVHSCRSNLSHKVGISHCKRSGYVEKERMYKNEDSVERGGAFKQPGEWTYPEVAEHFHCAVEEAAEPRIPCHFVNV